ncbi:hypothetical protein POL68_22220 [Stigmatella sp. ncwal1]|uniref:Uncharacterized protein n=1 Tax=Stigmatella ashevillensis TaxID=2995309 RepID=A0ABT5DC03_9BACT|nr:hypothetical protein [Stigmatella ashevillena]MDC0711202.1 hypothetical protein [Stigmatella ashevillena]
MSMELYVRDLCTLLKENALEAKEESRTAPEAQRAFALGRLMAFHEVISLMQQQAQAFGISLEELGLDTIRPEKDLV